MQAQKSGDGERVYVGYMAELTEGNKVLKLQSQFR